MKRTIKSVNFVKNNWYWFVMWTCLLCDINFIYYEYVYAHATSKTDSIMIVAATILTTIVVKFAKKAVKRNSTKEEP